MDDSLCGNSARPETWARDTVKPIISVGHTDNRISYQCATLIRNFIISPSFTFG